MTSTNRTAARLLAVALIAGMLSTGCAATTEVDKKDPEAQGPEGVTPPTNGIGVGNVHLTVKNESATLLKVAMCDALPLQGLAGCTSRLVASGESIEYTSGGIPGVLGQIIGAVQIDEGGGKGQLLGVLAQNPAIGVPSVEIGGLNVRALLISTGSSSNTCIDAETGLSEGEGRTIKCAVGLEGLLQNWQTSSAVPVRYRMQRVADSQNNTKEMTVTFEHAGPRLVGTKLLEWLR